MASSEDTFVLRSAVEFGFHSVHDSNIKLSSNGLLAERINPSRTHCGGVVYGAKVLRGTTEFEVEITSYDGTKWTGTLKLGVMQCKAGSKIKHSDIPKFSPGTTNYCMWHTNWGPNEVDNKLVGYSGPTRKKYGSANSVNLKNLRKGDRLGLRVSHKGVLTFFVNGKSQGVAAQGIYQDGYDLYPVVDVCGQCEAVRITRAVQRIDSGTTSQEQVLKEQVAVLRQQEQVLKEEEEVAVLRQQLKVFQEDFETERRDRQRMSEEKLRCESEIVSLRQERDRYKHQVTQLLTEKERLRQQIVEKDRNIQSLQSEKERFRQQVAEKDQSILSLQREKERFRQQVATLRQQVQRNAPQPQSDQSYLSKFWEVPREEISLNMQKILGTGAWGFVVEGTFRGQRVAVKCLHDMIREPYFLMIIRKEIDIMAQIRHPNLVMLIAAVIDAENDPLVVTELLDMSLRKAYERNLLEGSSKLNIFRDIASALNYLHLHHHGEIIHRDVSSANVLLEAKPNNQWKAKLSDFGSAKLAMEAKTTGPGAPVYAAPEIMREMGIRQTAKVDVYSYGILLCEVTMGQFPLEERLPSMIQVIQDRWVFMHGLITACIQEHPDNRPTMSHVLTELNKLRPT